MYSGRDRLARRWVRRQALHRICPTCETRMGFLGASSSKSVGKGNDFANSPTVSQTLVDDSNVCVNGDRSAAMTPAPAVKRKM